MILSIEVPINHKEYSDLVAFYSAFEKELQAIGYTAEDIRNYYRMQFGITAEELQRRRNEEQGF
jgi:hypothetical protein